MKFFSFYSISRWLRLLFGREFPLQDLLVLWDAIFAVGNQFELTNFIVVAMLIRIRKQCKYKYRIHYNFQLVGSPDSFSNIVLNM